MGIRPTVLCPKKHRRRLGSRGDTLGLPEAEDGQVVAYCGAHPDEMLRAREDTKHGRAFPNLRDQILAASGLT